MTEPSVPAFYTDHVPQSEYRRTSELRSRGDRTRLDVVLPTLALTDPALAKALREKIKAEDAQLCSILLPQSICSEVDSGKYLPHIFKQLGI